MRTEEDKKGCGYEFIALVVAMACAPYAGYVTVRLWAWFILPVFPMLPALSIIKAIGLRLVWQWLCPAHVNWDDQKEASASKKLGRSICMSTLYPSVILLFGYVYSHFAK